VGKKDKITRRAFIKKSLITAALSTQMFFNIKCSKNDEKVKIGYIPITDATPLLIAHANGYYKEEGLSVAEPVLIRSWSALVEAFLAERVNVVHLLMPIPMWMRYNNNAKVKIVLWDHTNGSAITVRSDSGINNFSDLGGKQIAVPYWYSMHNVILQMGIKKEGLKPVIKPQSEKIKNDEVNLFILPPPDMPVSLAAKKIDGYIVAEPFNALGEIKIKAKILRFTGDIWKNHPCCTIVMNEKLTKGNPVFTQKVVNAIVRAQGWILQNRDKTAKILSKDGKGYLPVNEDVTLKVFKDYDINKYGKGNLPQAIKHPEWHNERIGFQPYPYPSATKFIYETLGSTIVEGDNSFLKKYKPDFVVEDLVDYRFVKKAIDNIGGVAKFPEIDITSPWEREEIIEI
jgi:NitT/TauT family transport system substrate-binding protein